MRNAASQAMLLNVIGYLWDSFKIALKIKPTVLLSDVKMILSSFWHAIIADITSFISTEKNIIFKNKWIALSSVAQKTIDCLAGK